LDTSWATYIKRTKQHIPIQNDQFAMSKFSKWAFNLM
jgi:hypothetical protein